MPITRKNSINIQSAKKCERREENTACRGATRAKYVTGNTQWRVIINISSGFETVDKLGTTRRTNKIELLANKTRKLGPCKAGPHCFTSHHPTGHHASPPLFLQSCRCVRENYRSYSKGGKKILGGRAVEIFHGASAM